MSANSPVAVQWNKMTVYRPPHQMGSCDSTVPKFNYVASCNGNMGGSFKTTSQTIKFTLPKTIGTVFKTSLRFQINNSTVDNAGQPVRVPAPPTPFWVKEIEVHIGNDTLETIHAHDIYNETFGFLSLDELGATQASMNSRGLDYVSGADLPAGVCYRYLPFNNCLSTARLYNKGIAENVEFWVNMPSEFFAGSQTVNLTDLQLIVEEDTHVSGDDDKKWQDAGKSTLVYNTVLRQRQTNDVARSPGVESVVKMNGTKGNSAGLVIYSNDGSKATASNSKLTARNPIYTLEIDYNGGDKRTQNLQGDWLTAYAWTDNVHTPFASSVSTYLIPFSADFRGALEDGRNCGSTVFDGTDNLNIGYGSVAQNENVVITNYLYAQIIIAGGKYQSNTR